MNSLPSSHRGDAFLFFQPWTVDRELPTSGATCLDRVMRSKPI
ncbi:MAG: hypothetical protein ACRYGA_12650 [Janthinobacterium lividum]